MVVRKGWFGQPSAEIKRISPLKSISITQSNSNPIKSIIQFKPNPIQETGPCRRWDSGWTEVRHWQVTLWFLSAPWPNHHEQRCVQHQKRRTPMRGTGSQYAGVAGNPFASPLFLPLEWQSGTNVKIDERSYLNNFSTMVSAHTMWFQIKCNVRSFHVRWLLLLKRT